jgi:hypothetical protein
MISKFCESEGKHHGAMDPGRNAAPPGAARLSWWLRGLRGGFGLAILSGFFILLVSGCGTDFPILQRMKPLPAEPACRVAVLPFSSESDYPLAELIAYKIFSAQFAALDNAWVAQEGDVQKVYQNLRIFPGQLPTPEQLQILASRLNVQLLIMGHVVEMRENPGPNNSINPVLALRMDIVEGHTADTLWSTYHRRQGADYQKAMHFGQIHSVTGLCRQLSEEIITLWIKKGFPRCDVSSRF